MNPTLSTRHTETERRYLCNVLTQGLRIGNWTSITERRYQEPRDGYSFGMRPGKRSYLSDVRVIGYKLELTIPPKLLRDNDGEFYPFRDKLIITNTTYHAARRDLEQEGLACEACGAFSRPKQKPKCSTTDPCAFKLFIRRRTLPYTQYSDGLFTTSEARGKQKAELYAQVSGSILKTLLSLEC